jgi:hypothetical protein
MVGGSTETPQSVVPREREETGMTDGVTRGEIDAKLQTIEARMDSRVARMESLVERSIEQSKTTTTELKEGRRHTDLVVLAGVGAVIAVVAVAIALLQGQIDTMNSWLQIYLAHLGTAASHLPKDR